MTRNAFLASLGALVAAPFAFFRPAEARPVESVTIYTDDGSNRVFRACRVNDNLDGRPKPGERLDTWLLSVDGYAAYDTYHFGPNWTNDAIVESVTEVLNSRAAHRLTSVQTVFA